MAFGVDTSKSSPLSNQKSRQYFSKTVFRWAIYLLILLPFVILLYLFLGGQSNFAKSEQELAITRRWSSTLPSAKRLNREQVQLLSSTKNQWSSPCSENCTLSAGFASCIEHRCSCKLGYGGDICNFTISSLYGNHDVYKDMELRELDASGWDRGENLYEVLVKKTQPNLVVEVGVWKGASASKLAQALQNQNSGVLVAVDTWLPVIQFWLNHEALNRMHDLFFVNGYPDIFHTFTGNMVHLNLTSCVIPFPATSRVASDYFTYRSLKAELIHIDAAHHYPDVVDDLKLWWKHLRPGGIMLGDDWSDGWPGVVQAVREHARDHNLQIYCFNNKWWIEKPLEVDKV